MRKLRESLLLIAAAGALRGQTLPDIRDSMEPLDLPQPSVVLNLLPYVAAALLIAVLIYWRYRSRSRRGNTESPESYAQRRLANVAYTTSRAFYGELHIIFVEYLESRVLTKATRCTTPELLQTLTEADFLSADWRASVAGFLADCDRAKFSSWEPEPDGEPDAAVAECNALINQVATAPLLATAIVRRVNELV
jgi:hypothetical protein